MTNYTYIRHALKLGALDYILKPEMKLEDVTALLNKVTIFSDLRKPSKSYNMNHSSFYDRNNRALNRFISTTTIPASDFFKELSVPLDTKNLIIFIIRLEEPVEDHYGVNSLQHVCDKTLSSESIKGITLGHGDETLILLYEPRTSIAEFRKADQTKIELLCQRNIKSLYDKNIYCSIHQVCRDPNSFRNVLQDSLVLLDACRYYNDTKIPLPLKNLSDDEVISFTQNIRQKLALRQSAEAASDFMAFVANLHKSRITPKDVTTAIVYAITIMFANITFSLSNTTYNNDYSNFIRCVNQSRNERETEKIMEEFIEYYMNCHRKVSLNISPPMKLAIEYINQNYMHKITLESVASHVYLNKTYLSQLFKKQLNMSFGEYLEEVRISRAKILLSNSSMNITQIAGEIGYASQSYFTKVFKKKTGMGPLKYRAIVIPNAAGTYQRQNNKP